MALVLPCWSASSCYRMGTATGVVLVIGGAALYIRFVKGWRFSDLMYVTRSSLSSLTESMKSGAPACVLVGCAGRESMRRMQRQHQHGSTCCRQESQARLAYGGRVHMQQLQASARRAMVAHGRPSVGWH